MMSVAVTIEEPIDSVGVVMENPTEVENGAESLVTQPGISNLMGLLVALIPGGVIGFFVYKLVKSLRDKEKAKEEKKKMKQMRKEKELSKKQKKK